MEKSAAELAASQEEVARAATRAESAEAYVGAMATELTDSKRETEELQKQAETAQKRARSLEEELRSKFELETLRAVAEETRKWEAQEDRLTRCLDELEELRNREDGIRAAIWRAKRNKNQSATLRPLPRAILRGRRYDVDPVLLQGAFSWGQRDIYQHHVTIGNANRMYREMS